MWRAITLGLIMLYVAAIVAKALWAKHQHTKRYRHTPRQDNETLGTRLYSPFVRAEEPPGADSGMPNTREW